MSAATERLKALKATLEYHKIYEAIEVRQLHDRRVRIAEIEAEIKEVESKVKPKRKAKR